MSDLRILIVEDQERWTTALSRMLSHLVVDPPHIARKHSVAVQHVQEIKFDLVVADLALPGAFSDARTDLERGFDVLREMRESHYNEDSALVVVSGQVKSEQLAEAVRHFRIHGFVDKDAFDDDSFLEKVGNALLTARIERAKKGGNLRHRLTIHFDHNQILGSELKGPIARRFHSSAPPPLLDACGFATRANSLNTLIAEGEAGQWRQDAKTLGSELYAILTQERRIVEGLAVTTELSDIWLEFSGPQVGLGIPFELLHDGSEYLVFKHIVTRCVGSVNNSRKLAPFRKFISSFQRGKIPLRILIVASDPFGDIPFVNQEAESLRTQIETDLNCLGIKPRINVLSGKQATHSAVSAALRDGYHFFHYAGHSCCDEQQPESSGLIVLSDHDGRTRLLTAAYLATVARDTELRLVYLSCCQGARSTPELRSGDFYGFFDALANADVPMILGYRWEVGDTSAVRFSEPFYHHLWRTLCPGQALFEARQKIGGGDEGRNNQTWASPILLMQNT